MVMLVYLCCLALGYAVTRYPACLVGNHQASLKSHRTNGIRSASFHQDLISVHYYFAAAVITPSYSRDAMYSIVRWK